MIFPHGYETLLTIYFLRENEFLQLMSSFKVTPRVNWNKFWDEVGIKWMISLWVLNDKVLEVQGIWQVEIQINQEE